MRTVPLGGKKAAGRVALVDDEDFELVASRSWHAVEACRCVYAQTNVLLPDGRRGTTKMHNLIMGTTGVDHVNHDGLDNQRTNLRPATQAENGRNVRKSASSSSQYKGVRAYAPVGGEPRYQARIRVNDEPVHIGTFSSEEDAAIAYDIYARALFGEFACLNFPERHDTEVPRQVVAGTPVPIGMILTLRAAGQSFVQIAETAGVSPSRIFQRYYAATGTTPALRRRPGISDEEIVRLRDSGHDWAEIASRVGLSSSASRARYYRLTGKQPRPRARRA
jgi:AraC-like DNA-binding protein